MNLFKSLTSSDAKGSADYSYFDGNWDGRVRLTGVPQFQTQAGADAMAIETRVVEIFDGSAEPKNPIGSTPSQLLQFPEGSDIKSKTIRKKNLQRARAFWECFLPDGTMTQEAFEKLSANDGAAVVALEMDLIVQVRPVKTRSGGVITTVTYRVA